MTIENLDFGRGHGRNFDHLTMFFFKFWPWSWSKFFDHMTMTPGRRPNCQKIMVALPPPLVRKWSKKRITFLNLGLCSASFLYLDLG